VFSNVLTNAAKYSPDQSRISLIGRAGIAHGDVV